MSEPALPAVVLPGGRELPESALREAFVTAGGPGGQNVNKVATRVQLSVRVDELPLSPDEIERVRTRLAGRISGDGVLTVAASRTRHQLANRKLARERLAELLADALVVVPPRRRKPVPRSVHRKRLENKKRTSDKKQQRRWRPGDQ
jgi:ribosome-associated protein